MFTSSPCFQICSHQVPSCWGLLSWISRHDFWHKLDFPAMAFSRIVSDPTNSDVFGGRWIWLNARRVMRGVAGWRESVVVAQCASHWSSTSNPHFPSVMNRPEWEFIPFRSIEWAGLCWNFSLLLKFPTMSYSNRCFDSIWVRWFGDVNTRSYAKQTWSILSSEREWIAMLESTYLHVRVLSCCLQKQKCDRKVLSNGWIN